MKKFVSLVAVGVLALSMVGCGKKADSSKENVLRVGMEGTYAPYTYHDESGKLTGFEVDVANAIGEKLGMKVEFVETEWDSMFEALDKGNFDVAMNQITIKEDRAEAYDFSTPYIFSKPILIVASSNTDINGFNDISGKKAAEALTSNFNSIAKEYGAEIVGQDEFALAMQCLISGEADCVINDELTYGYWLSVKGDTDSTKIVATADEAAQSAACVKKGNKEILDKVNGAIDELLKEGEISKISEKYFAMDISKQ